VPGSVSIERVAGGSACAVDIAVHDRAKTQDDARTSFSGRHTRPKRCGGRGTGATKATGSYEGSLLAEGTSGRHEPSAFTSRWSRRPWRLPHTGRAAQTARKSSARPLEGRAKALPDSVEEGEATEVSEARSAAGAVGTKRPRSCSPPPDTERESRRQNRQRVSSYDPPKRSRVS